MCILFPPTCYTCCRHASTREHVPPKAFFPERKNLPQGIDLRRNLVTVPSCTRHNTEKADDDEYLLYVIVTCYEAGPMAQHHYLTKLRPVLKEQPRVKAFFAQARQILVDGHVTGVYDVDQARVERVLDLMARAIYFHHFGRKWRGPLVLTVAPILRLRAFSSPQYAEVLSTTERGAEMLFRDHSRHGENPEVFYYQVHQEQAQAETAIRLVFYEQFSLTAVRKTSLPRVKPVVDDA